MDRWLWAARMFKTRSLASKACVAGHVKCNGVTVKAAKPVRVGDEIEVVVATRLRILFVLKLADKRGPAAVARTLYEDRSPPPEPKAERDTFVERDRGAGRPVKRERRILSRIRGR